MSEKKATKRSTKAAQTINAYRRLFSTDDGQVVLKDLMQSCYLSRSIIGPSVHDTYFNEGVRSVVLRILGTVNMDEKQIERIIIEMNRESDDMLI